MIKNALLAQLRRRAFQPLWEQLHRVSVIGQNFWSSSVAESGELKALDWLAPRMGSDAIVLDVGANTGQYAVAAADRLHPARIYSFEPSQKTFLGLCQAVTASGLGHVIHPQPFALSEHSGYATLYSSRELATIASLHNLRNPIEDFQEEESERVELRTVDEFCLAHGIDKIDLLKIDVEGHELSVLKGAERMLAECRIAHIQFEFGEANLDSRTYLRDFYDLLEKNFTLYRIVSNGLRALPSYRPSLEIFATMNYLAVNKGSS